MFVDLSTNPTQTPTLVLVVAIHVTLRFPFPSDAADRSAALVPDEANQLGSLRS